MDRLSINVSKIFFHQNADIADKNRSNEQQLIFCSSVDVVRDSYDFMSSHSTGVCKEINLTRLFTKNINKRLNCKNVNLIKNKTTKRKTKPAEQ